MQNIRVAGYLNGKRAIPIIIFRQPGANIIATVDRIRAQLPFIAGVDPARASTSTSSLDRTTTIRASVERRREDARSSRSALVIVVVFVFLRNARATLIPGVAVPRLAHRHVRA